MCYTGRFKDTDIAFDKGDIFKENGIILIKNAKNADENHDKVVPHTIPLHEINMKHENKETIRNIFLLKKTKEKTEGKLRKQRA